MAGRDPAVWASAVCAEPTVRPPAALPTPACQMLPSRDDRSLGSLTRRQELHAPHVKGFKLFQGPDTADHPDMRGRGPGLHNGPPPHPHAQPLGPGEVPRWGLGTGTPPPTRSLPGHNAASSAGLCQEASQQEELYGLKAGGPGLRACLARAPFWSVCIIRN